MSKTVENFTMEALDWAPRVRPIDPDEATPAQQASLRETPSNLKVSAYSLVLAHDPEALSARTPLYNAVMYGPRGLPRPDRELAALAESYVNGCVYCASVHARRFSELTKEPGVVQRLYAEGTGIPLDARRRAVVDYAVKLTATPPSAGKDDVAALRDASLGDLEILDLTHVVAMFSWANRLMQTLGDPVPAEE